MALNRSKEFGTVPSSTKSRRARDCRCHQAVRHRHCTTSCVPAGPMTPPLARRPTKSKCDYRKKSFFDSVVIVFFLLFSLGLPGMGRGAVMRPGSFVDSGTI